MVSRSQPQQQQEKESTMFHSSGGGSSNSSGSTTAAIPVVVDDGTTTAANLGKTPFQLLRRSANKMKLSNLFRSSHDKNKNNSTSATFIQQQHPITNEGNGHAEVATYTTSPNYDNVTISSSVIVTMDTTVEDKQQQQREMMLLSNSRTTVWMESLYQSEMPVVVDDTDTVEHDITSNTATTTIAAAVLKNNKEEPLQQPPIVTNTTTKNTTTTGPTIFCNDTNSLPGPFFDRMCHIGRTASEDSETIRADKQIKQNFHSTLPDDPSIQESIECVFMAQQESMLFREQQQKLKRQHIVDTANNDRDNKNKLPERSDRNKNRYSSNSSIQTPPSTIHQSLLKNRSISRLPIQFQRDVISRSPRASSSSSSVMVVSQQQEHATNVDITNHPNMFQQRIPPPENTSSIFSGSAKNATNNPIPELHMSNSILKTESTEQCSGTNASAPPPTSATSSPTSATSCCTCCQRHIPMLEPELWPQRPLLLRPTPNSGTRITGIRFVSSSLPNEYLWKATDENNTPTSESSLTWPQALRKHWAGNSDANQSSLLATNVDQNRNSTTTTDMCSKCMIMPINNGKELPGESLVSDFESELFIGTILIRLKDCHGTTMTPDHEQPSTGGYFHNLHRRYQVVIRGQFKQSLPWTECMTGFQLERPCGKLPPKWIVNGALNVVRFFAPQLQTNVTCPRPYSLTPLGSTPQSLIVHDIEPPTTNTGNNKSLTDRMKCDRSMEVPQEEPRTDTNTLIGHASNASSSMQRARYRKKHFDKMYSDVHHHDKHHHHSNRSLRANDHINDGILYTDPTKVYTFEFLQHLLSFDDFTIEMGSIVGSVPLQTILNGQPLQIMSSYQNPASLSQSGTDNSTRNADTTVLQNRFWCFDIWHEMLYADAKAYDDAVQQQHTNGGMRQQVVSSDASHDHTPTDDVFCNQMST